MKTIKEVVIEQLCKTEGKTEETATYFIEMNDGWFNFLSEVVKEYAKEACKEQRSICADEATSYASYGESYVNEDTILYAPQPEFL